MPNFTHGIATASWINKAIQFQAAAGPAVPGTSLPVNDGSGPGASITRAFFEACRGFRFANFLEVGVQVENGKVVNAGFTPDSRGFFADSFLGHPSHAYKPLRTMRADGEARVFTQTVGARTTGQEEVGGAVGTAAGISIAPWLAPISGPVGKQVGKRAARAATPFAPIWSTLEIRLSPAGQATSRLVTFSLFPSLTYYDQATQLPNTLVATLDQKPLPYGPARYDATQDSMLLWFKSGWGPLRGGSLGPTPGNPWGVENDGNDEPAKPGS